MRLTKRALPVAAMVFALLLMPLLSTPSGAEGAQGIIQGLIKHCPSSSTYKGQVTVALHFPSGAVEISASTLARNGPRPSRFTWWVSPGDYYITVNGGSGYRWPFRVRYFRVTSGKTVVLPQFKDVCAY
jgi:hypothetical protein